ncbi:hypothetical protein GQ457_15G018240 [Hibiscus cannabinus]
MLLLLLWRCFDILLQQDDKGDVSNRDNGSYLGRLSRPESNFGRASCRVIGLSYQKEGRNRVKVKDLKPKRIKGYLEYKFSQKTRGDSSTVEGNYVQASRTVIWT